MDALKGKIADLSEKYLQAIIDFRRHIHQHPELSFQEKHTANYIASTFARHGVKTIPFNQHHSFMAIVEGKGSGKTIGIRAELDALPITEESDLEYKSNSKGVMHACGHDIHIAAVAGTGIILHELREFWNGRVLLIFESGEELLPGGARAIVNSDVFLGMKPDIMLGLHVLPEMETGKVGFCPGRYMASGDEIYLNVRGKGGHAALPHTLIDPVVIASHIVIALQTLISRNTPPMLPAVLSFGKIEASGATNVIPSNVYIEGTLRTLDENWRETAHGLIVQNAKGVAQAMGGNCDVEIRQGYPFVYNNPELTRKVQSIAMEFLGDSNVVSLEPRMTTDDFAYFSQEIPSVFFRLGVGTSNSSVTQLHTPKFVANEKSLSLALPLLTWITIKILEG